MKAIVLGARRDSNNIGENVAKRLENLAWEVHRDDCWREETLRYEIPMLNAHADADAMVVTLGATALTPFAEMDEAKIRNLIDGCLTLPLEAALEFVQCRGDAGGRVVFVGSYAHRHPFTNGTAYCSAKAGLDMATKTLAWELTERDFFFYIVHPYHVEGTPMWEEVQAGMMESRGMSRMEADDYAHANLKRPTLMGPDEVSHLIVNLLQFPFGDRLSGTSIEMFGGTR